MTREFKSLHHRARRNVGELSRACKLFDRVLVYAYWLSLLIEIQPGWRRTWRTSLALATLYADKCRRGIQVNCDVWKHAGWLFGIFVKPLFSRLPDQNQNFHDPIPPIVLAHLLVDKGQYPWPKRWSIFKECCIPFFSLMPGRRVGNGKGIFLLTISMPNGWHCLATWNPFPSVCFFFRSQRWLNEKEKTFLCTVLGHLSEETAIPKAVEVEEEAKKLGGGRDEVGHLRRFLTAL